MTNKLVLATATAIGLALSSAALANDNKAFIEQTGAFNGASITQSAGSRNEVGSAALVAKQNGSDANAHVTSNNSLRIVQSGDDNVIGKGSNVSGFGAAQGLVQKKSYAHISGIASAKNTLDIEQTSNGNVVGAISQDTATHSGVNGLVIRQGGAGGHEIGSVSQYRSQTTQNLATITQTGSNNRLARVDQYVTTYGNVTPNIVSNVIEIDMSGDGNGHGVLTGQAAASGAITSAVIQGRAGKAAKGNEARVNISGDSNEFGVAQYGEYNTIGTLMITGDDNEVGLFQEGNRNEIALATVAGLSNNIGIRQFGDDNEAGVAVLGNDNDIGVRQTGNQNTASVMVDGNNNYLDVGQNRNSGSLGGHALTVNIYGNNNNRAAMSGVASSAVAPLTTGISWGPGVGQVLQGGSGNTATINIGTASLDSNGNRFATNQQGQGNTLTATVGGGNGNQFGVSQIGNANVASLTQNGSTNSVGISQ